MRMELDTYGAGHSILQIGNYPYLRAWGAPI